MSNLLLDQSLPVTQVQDLKKTVRQAGQEESVDTPYTAPSQITYLPSIYSDLMFDQQSISTTRNLVARWTLTPGSHTGDIFQTAITAEWMFNNVSRFNASRRFNVYNDFVICLELMCNGSPQTWGSIYSYFIPEGIVGMYIVNGLDTYTRINTQQYMIQPLHVNTKRTWMIPTDKPFDFLRASNSYPDNYQVGVFGIAILNTIRSTSTTTSSPELQLWASASVTYGGTIYNGTVAL
ncbi:MAG: hypothetical protein GuPV1_gp1 [Guiyang polycipivirus 1]|nr:MAG: hypothetical protein GuPV1_gp1 [Guiyang polycipivirus 1]